jgi:hypothetical protein
MYSSVPQKPSNKAPPKINNLLFSFLEIKNETLLLL